MSTLGCHRSPYLGGTGSPPHTEGYVDSVPWRMSMLHSGCAFRGRGSFEAAIAPRPSSSDAKEASQQQHQFHESFYRVSSGGLKTASTSSERELKPK